MNKEIFRIANRFSKQFGVSMTDALAIATDAVKTARDATASQTEGAGGSSTFKDIIRDIAAERLSSGKPLVGRQIGGGPKKVPFNLEEYIIRLLYKKKSCPRRTMLSMVGFHGAHSKEFDEVMDRLLKQPVQTYDAFGLTVHGVILQSGNGCQGILGSGKIEYFFRETGTVVEQKRS